MFGVTIREMSSVLEGRLKLWRFGLISLSCAVEELFICCRSTISLCIDSPKCQKHTIGWTCCWVPFYST